jgi:predicted metal-dependent hydrolase
MADGPAAPPAAGTILQGGRAKAYRPMPADDRKAAYAAGLDAYRRGDFFLAHELLEPAWMGTADIGERELYQGLIKLAAGFVHSVRGNPRGIARNLEGARALLASARGAGFDGGLDLHDLLASIDDRLARLAASETDVEPPILRRNDR